MVNATLATPIPSSIVTSYNSSAVSHSIQKIASKGTLIVGTVNTLLTDIALYLKNAGHNVVIGELNISPSFDLTQEKQSSIDRLRKAKISIVLIKNPKEFFKEHKKIMTVIFVPPVVSLYKEALGYESTGKGNPYLGSVVKDFVTFIKFMTSKEDSNMRLVYLTTIPEEPIKESLLKLFSLVLDSYRSSRGLNVSTITVEEGFNEEKCANFNELIYYVYSSDRHSNNGVLECRKKEGALTVLTESTTGRQNVLFSTYFTKNKQFVRPYRENSFQFVKGFVITAKRHNARIVIYYDQIDTGYKERLLEYYSNIEFIHYTGNFHRRTINDARFYIMHDYLQDHPEIDRIILQDLRDGIFLTDPFKVMELAGDYLYLGMDASFHRSFSHIGVYRKCITAKRKKLFAKKDQYYPKLNAGSLGGTRHVVLAFLKQIIKNFNDLFPPRSNCNMDTFDLTGHHFFKNIMVTGYPFQGYMQIGLASPPGIVLRHKRTKFDM